MSDEKDYHPDTLLAHAGFFEDEESGALVPPIQPSTTFVRRGDDYELVGDYLYSRYGGPTQGLVERLVARLEGGAEGLTFGSGLAAFAAFFETVRAGEHVVAPRVMYFGAQAWLRRMAERRGVGLTLFDPGDPQALERALVPGRTAVVWIESPVNPTWDVIDIEAAARAAHAVGAVLGVDSTVAPPVTSRPLELGADFVFHSATKYLGGHSDVTAGLLVCRDANERWQEIRLVRQNSGGILSAFDAWLLLRGLRTLALRFERSSDNALEVARALEGHPKLEGVLYPGLPSHPGHAVASRQMRGGFGGMLSILYRGSFEETRQVATRTRVFRPATSLGGVESLIEHRASLEGPDSVVPPNLLRLSVGIERAEDLVEDLLNAI